MNTSAKKQRSVREPFWPYVRRALIWLIILVVTATLADILRFTATLAILPTVGKAISTNDHPFSQTVSQARERILVIGDSTAVGIGAYITKETIAGMLATDFPDADIVNKAVSGSRIADVRLQLDAVQGDFDMVLMQAGANDVVFMSDPTEVERDLVVLMDAAFVRASRVVVISSIDASIIPLLPKIASLFLAHQSAKLLPDIKSIVEQKGGVYVDLYKSSEEQTFATNPNEFFSADGFHPSSDGYRLAYDRIKRDLLADGMVIEENGRLYIVPDETIASNRDMFTEEVPPDMSVQ